MFSLAPLWIHRFWKLATTEDQWLIKNHFQACNGHTWYDSFGFQLSLQLQLSSSSSWLLWAPRSICFALVVFHGKIKSPIRNDPSALVPQNTESYNCKNHLKIKANLSPHRAPGLHSSPQTRSPKGRGITVAEATKTSVYLNVFGEEEAEAEGIVKSTSHVKSAALKGY